MNAGVLSLLTPLDPPRFAVLEQSHQPAVLSMATSTNPFQLFPPAAPKVKINPPQSDHVVNFSRKTDPSSTESLIRSPNTESVVIRIIEDPEQDPEAYYEQDLRSRSASPEMEHETVPASPIDGHRLSLINIPPPPQVENPAPPPGDRATYIDPSPTSPVVPIRSMFPTYNPSLRLSQQQYYPQRVAELLRENVSRDDYIPSRSSSRLDEVFGGPKTAPASIVNFPLDALAVKEPRFSSVAELEKLWAATNGGHDPETLVGDFDLRMSRYVADEFVRVFDEHADWVSELATPFSPLAQRHHCRSTALRRLTPTNCRFLAHTLADRPKMCPYSSLLSNPLNVANPRTMGL